MIIYNKYNLLYERLFIINIIYYMNSYSVGMVFKVFSLRLFHTYFLRIQNKRKKKEFFYSLVFSLSVLRFSSTSDSLCPHTSIPPLRIDLEDRTVQIADL